MISSTLQHGRPPSHPFGRQPPILAVKRKRRQSEGIDHVPVAEPPFFARQISLNAKTHAKTQPRLANVGDGGGARRRRDRRPGAAPSIHRPSSPSHLPDTARTTIPTPSDTPCRPTPSLVCAAPSPPRHHKLYTTCSSARLEPLVVHRRARPSVRTRPRPLPRRCETPHPGNRYEC